VQAYKAKICSTKVSCPNFLYRIACQKKSKLKSATDKQNLLFLPYKSIGAIHSFLAERYKWHKYLLGGGGLDNDQLSTIKNHVTKDIQRPFPAKALIPQSSQEPLPDHTSLMTVRISATFLVQDFERLSFLQDQKFLFPPAFHRQVPGTYFALQRFQLLTLQVRARIACGTACHKSLDLQSTIGDTCRTQSKGNCRSYDLPKTNHLHSSGAVIYGVCGGHTFGEFQPFLDQWQQLFHLQ